MRASGWAFGFLLGLASVQPAQAQQRRPIAASEQAEWKHSGSGVSLPATVDGSRRVGITDSGAEELDVAAQFEGADGLITTVYLFRSQVPNVPLWFDRGRTVLEQLRFAGDADHAPVTSTSFALPGHPIAGAMRITFPFEANGFQSTGLAMASVNGWLVKVRMSSKSLNPLQLDAKLAAFVGAIGWPAASGPMVPVEPIQPCADKLTFRAAKMVKPDMAQNLLGSLLMMSPAKSRPAKPLTYCREASEGVLYGVYRPIGEQDSYLMAIADSGRALSVGPDLNLESKAKATYSVTFLDLDRSSLFPSFDRLPAPAQAMNIVRSTRPLSSTKVGSTTIEMNGGGR